MRRVARRQGRPAHESASEQQEGVAAAAQVRPCAAAPVPAHEQREPSAGRQPPHAPSEPRSAEPGAQRAPERESKVPQRDARRQGAVRLSASHGSSRRPAARRQDGPGQVQRQAGPAAVPAQPPVAPSRRDDFAVQARQTAERVGAPASPKAEDSPPPQSSPPWPQRARAAACPGPHRPRHRDRCRGRRRAIPRPRRGSRSSPCEDGNVRDCLRAGGSRRS